MKPQSGAGATAAAAGPGKTSSLFQCIQINFIKQLETSLNEMHHEQAGTAQAGQSGRMMRSRWVRENLLFGAGKFMEVMFLEPEWVQAIKVS